MAVQPIFDLALPAAPVETTPGSKATPRYKTFFAARDALDKALDASKLELTGPQVALFRYLIEHAWYNPRKPEDFGYVIDSALDYERIARRLGVNEKTIRRALPVLEELGLTSRYGRPLLAGGKDPDAIRVDWLLADTESASESGTESGSESGTESASSMSEEKERRESSSRARDDESSDGSFSQDRGGSAPHTPQRAQETRDSGRAASDYGAAVCRALNEFLPAGDSLRPTAKLSDAWDLLARLWPDPRDMPACEIVWGFESDAASLGQTHVGSHAAVLARNLETASEADIRFWAERGEQRLAEEEAAEQRLAERERAEREAADQAAREEQREAAARTEIESLIPVIGAAKRHNDFMGARGFNWNTQEEGEKMARHVVDMLGTVYKGNVQKVLVAVRQEAEKARKTQAEWEALMEAERELEGSHD